MTTKTDAVCWLVGGLCGGLTIAVLVLTDQKQVACTPVDLAPMTAAIERCSEGNTNLVATLSASVGQNTEKVDQLLKENGRLKENLSELHKGMGSLLKQNEELEKRLKEIRSKVRR